MKSSKIRLVLDAMLGRLARWLRIAGISTEYCKDVEDDELIKKAATQGLILVTRDKSLSQKAGSYCKTVLLKENSLEKQLAELSAKLKINIPRRGGQSLCTNCGFKLVKVAKKSVKELVWPRVYKANKNFWQCSHCAKIYWRGTHVKEISRTFNKIRRQGNSRSSAPRAKRQSHGHTLARAARFQGRRAPR